MNQNSDMDMREAAEEIAKTETSQANDSVLDEAGADRGNSTNTRQPLEAEEKAPHATSDAYEWVEWAAGVIVCVVLILTFVVRTVGVNGYSMIPTLQDGDRLLATRLGGSPSNGDIVAVTQPNSSNKPLIKRVIATGGQTVDIDFETGDVWVDGDLLDEPYIAEPISHTGEGGHTYPLTVPQGYLFCMGDNRNNSLDSRFEDVGVIDTRYVLGKVLIRFAPLDSIGIP